MTEIEHPATTLIEEEFEGEKYFTVQMQPGNMMIQTSFIARIMTGLIEDDFLVGVQDGRMTFVFRNRQDAGQFRENIRQFSFSSPRENDMFPRTIRGNAAQRTVYINGEELSPYFSLSIYNHSPDGFNWGYFGSGPAQLALAICLIYVDKDTALACYQDFKREFIALLHGGRDFELDTDVVKAWFDAKAKGGK